MREIKNCELCGNKDFKFLFKGKDKLLGIGGDFNLFECKKCEVIFLNPQPSYKELEKYYSNKKYYSLKKIDTISKKLKIKLSLYKIYFNSNEKNIFLKILFYPLKFIVRGTKIAKDARLLDVGCGSGQFLYEMKQFGLRTCGVEPGDFDRKTSKKENLNIFHGELKSARFHSNYFDIITLNHVLEHVNNPYETINEIYRILKNGGTFILGVPNTHSLSRMIFGSNWLALDVPRHLINYSDKNLKYLLKKEGFKVEKIRYNSRPNQFVVSLYFIMGIKKREGIFNRILEVIFLPFTWLVNFLRIGDQIEIYCKK